MSKTELPYFNIGDSYGGNQSWFIDPWMHIGGCGALTMCDFLLYMACFKGRKECYPYDTDDLKRRDYRRFGMSMKPYLRPRESGIKDIDTFIEGARIYLEDTEIEGITIEGFDGNRNYGEAEKAIIESIDSGMPVAMLMLRHQNKEFSFFEWHWFLIVGYDGIGDTGDPAAEQIPTNPDRHADDTKPCGLRIKVATYGKAWWLPLRELWDTGCEEKGGLVFFSTEMK